MSFYTNSRISTSPIQAVVRSVQLAEELPFTATPCYAQILSSLYAHDDGGRTCRTSYETLRRHTVKGNVQNIAKAVANVAQIKEEKWEYEIPPLDQTVTSIGVGLDGAYVLFRDEGRREASAIRFRFMIRGAVVI